MHKVVIINKTSISKYGGMLQDYMYTPGATTSVLQSGTKKTIFNLFSQKTGKGSLVLTLIIKGRNREELQRNTDAITGLFSGLCEIKLDGYLFRFALSQIGAAEHKGQRINILSITGNASKHLGKVSTAGKKIYCRSEVPETDCILKVKVTAAAQKYILGSVTFINVAADDELTVDGINCKITKNGIPCASACEFTELTRLKPGYNNIACSDLPIVSYYPTFY